MFLRSLNFSSIKTTRFYLLQNQSSAAGSQPPAMFWCNPITHFYEIPAVGALFRMFRKVKIVFLPPRTLFLPCGNLVTKQKRRGDRKIRDTTVAREISRFALRKTRFFAIAADVCTEIWCETVQFAFSFARRRCVRRCSR